MEKYFFKTILLTSTFVMAFGFASIVKADGPAITSILPDSINAGSPAFTITITGTNFANGSRAYFAGHRLDNVYQYSTSMVVSVPASLVTTPGIYAVQVYSSESSPNWSNITPFTVNFPAGVVSGPVNETDPTAIVIINKITYGGNDSFGFTINDSVKGYNQIVSITTQNGYWTGYPNSVGGGTTGPLVIPIPQPLPGTDYGYGGLPEHRYTIRENVPTGWILKYAYCTRRRITMRPNHPEDFIPTLFIFTGQSMSNLPNTSSAVQNPINIEGPGVVTTPGNFSLPPLSANTVTSCTFVDFKDGFDMSHPPFPDSPVPWLPSPSLTTLERLGSQYFGVTDFLPLIALPCQARPARTGTPPITIDDVRSCTIRVGQLFGQYPPITVNPDGTSICGGTVVLQDGHPSESARICGQYPLFFILLANAILANLLNPNPQLSGATWTPIPLPPPPIDAGGNPSISGGDFLTPTPSATPIQSTVSFLQSQSAALFGASMVLKFLLKKMA